MISVILLYNINSCLSIGIQFFCRYAHIIWLDVAGIMLMLHNICFGYHILYMVMAGKIKNPFVYTMQKAYIFLWG